jgi:hypothetical protein
MLVCTAPGSNCHPRCRISRLVEPTVLVGPSVLPISSLGVSFHPMPHERAQGSCRISRLVEPTVLVGPSVLPISSLGVSFHPTPHERAQGSLHFPREPSRAARSSVLVNLMAHRIVRPALPISSTMRQHPKRLLGEHIPDT